jgi:hypothetical protein
VDQRVRLRTFCAAVLAAILFLAAGFAASGDDFSLPSEAEEPNQVLEIPQQCSSDAVAALCDRSDASAGTNAGSVGSAADANGAPGSDGGDASTTQGNAVADGSGAARDNSAVAASAGDANDGAYGSVYDYENQFSGNAPEMVPQYVVPMPVFVRVAPVYSYPPVYSAAPVYSYLPPRPPRLWRRYAPRPGHFGRLRFGNRRRGR